MRDENTKTVQWCDRSSPSWRAQPRNVGTTLEEDKGLYGDRGWQMDEKKAGRKILEEVWAADGHPEKQSTVEPMEGGSMVEEGLTAPGGQPTVAEQVVVEPKVEAKSQDDTENLEGQGRTDGSSDQG